MEQSPPTSLDFVGGNCEEQFLNTNKGGKITEPTYRKTTDEKDVGIMQLISIIV